MDESGRETPLVKDFSGLKVVFLTARIDLGHLALDLETPIEEKREVLRPYDRAIILVDDVLFGLVEGELRFGGVSELYLLRSSREEEMVFYYRNLFGAFQVKRF